MTTDTLSHRPDAPAPQRVPESHTRRLAIVGVTFFAATIAAGAVLIPPVARLLGLHLSTGQGALVSLILWVPSALFVAGRSIAAMRRSRGNQRERLSSSAAVSESL